MYIISWFDQSTIKHLRFPFSFFLMPVFLFALSQAEHVSWPSTLIGFLILHLLIFPSSNGYNSFQDRDETSIGGLKYPPKVSRKLYYASILFDVIGIGCGLFVSVYFSLFVLIFVIVSRAYSYRNLRLKKYPFTGFLTVFIFQGAFVYLIASSSLSTFVSAEYFTENHVICMFAASFFIGSMYPLTQIYQHQADKEDGVISISYKLGYIGTFVFSAVLFSIASGLLFYNFSLKHRQIAFLLFVIIMLPVITKLGIWFHKVREDTGNANFENTMQVNLMTSTCMNFYFLLLILNNHYIWF
jgi:1,4-dihydroxy-2-naphthoate polyprenyltransferase